MKTVHVVFLISATMLILLFSISMLKAFGNKIMSNDVRENFECSTDPNNPGVCIKDLGFWAEKNGMKLNGWCINRQNLKQSNIEMAPGQYCVAGCNNPGEPFNPGGRFIRNNSNGYDWQKSPGDLITDYIPNTKKEYCGASESPFGDSLINYTSLTQASRDSIGTGWRQIKYLPGDSTTWFPGNDQLKNYGGTEFLFTTGDFSRWLICDQSVVNGETYFNEERAIKKSSISADPYTARWYNRHWDKTDPVVSLEDHGDSVMSNTIMYVEEATTGHADSIHSSGMYVFVR
jgi:hypothetical protein